MIRAPGGGSTGLEIRAKPCTKFGHLMQSIDAPLYIGTVSFEGGGSSMAFYVKMRGLQAQE
jgi:hypothetical protein